MCFLRLPVFIWLGREIAQCNWSESRYGIILSLVFFVCLLLSLLLLFLKSWRVKKNYPEIIIVVMWWNFTHPYVYVSKNIYIYIYIYIETREKEKKRRRKVGKNVKSNVVKLCKVVYVYCHYTISMDWMGVGRCGNAK